MAECNMCSPGSLCPVGASMELPAACRPGTYSKSTDLDLDGSPECSECDAGFYCPGGAAPASSCFPGSFSNASGALQCEVCKPGSYSAGGATSCIACEDGKYADNKGQSKCIPCPYPLSSDSGSALCAKALSGFFLSDTSVTPSELLENPAKYSQPCPLHADCAENATLETLGIPTNFWRASPYTTRVYECFLDFSGESSCRGSGSLMRRLDDTKNASDGIYCIEGHRGPQCALCSRSSQYFGFISKRCEACPDFVGLLIRLSIALAVAGLLLLGYMAAQRFERLGRLARRTSVAMSNISLQAKFKILVSFYQVFNTLENVYGVRLHPYFARWLDWLVNIPFLNFDVMTVLVPGSCIGSMQARLLLSGTWPWVVVFFAAFLITLHGLTFVRRSQPGVPVVTLMLDRCLYSTIFIVYLLLPSTSRSIFSARQCISFGYDDRGDTADDVEDRDRSYLLADLNVRCTSEDAEYTRLQIYFWIYFVLWPTLIPLVAFGLMKSIVPSIRQKRLTATAKACRFLWRDYDPTVLFWEIIDTIRKLVLTALILFVDTEQGAKKMMRIVLATFISSSYVVILALVRPFKRSDDLILACISNLLLTTTFVSGIVIKLCEDGQWSETCKAFVGFSSSYQASLFVMTFSILMMVIALGIVAIKVFAAVTAPTIRLKSTRQEPFLELPPGCIFHGFISHTWATGQDQTHTIVRQLQLLVPEMKIWLDVDFLDDVGRLEEAVATAANFIIFLSKGYFESQNCRRELYAALAADRPMIAVQEADKNKGGADIGELKEECRKNCTSEDAVARAFPTFPGPNEVLKQVFGVEEHQMPIVWVRVHDFQMASLKEVVLRLLKHSSYYKSDGHAKELASGLIVPGEIDTLGFKSPVTLLVCSANEGAWRIAKELQAVSMEGRQAIGISLQEAETVLNEHSSAPQGKTAMLLYLTKDTFLDSDGKVAAAVQHALDLKISIALVQEQDVSRGGCPFSVFFDQTPKHLQLQPYSLYNELAVPYFPSTVHCTISRRHVLRKMGAVELRSSASGTDETPEAGAAVYQGQDLENSSRADPTHIVTVLRVSSASSTRPLLEAVDQSLTNEVVECPKDLDMCPGTDAGATGEVAAETERAATCTPVLQGASLVNSTDFMDAFDDLKVTRLWLILIVIFWI